MYLKQKLLHKNGFDFENVYINSSRIGLSLPPIVVCLRYGESKVPANKIFKKLYTTTFGNCLILYLALCSQGNPQTLVLKVQKTVVL